MRLFWGAPRAHSASGTSPALRACVPSSHNGAGGPPRRAAPGAGPRHAAASRAGRSGGPAAGAALPAAGGPRGAPTARRMRWRSPCCPSASAARPAPGSDGPPREAARGSGPGVPGPARSGRAGQKAPGAPPPLSAETSLCRDGFRCEQEVSPACKPATQASPGAVLSWISKAPPRPLDRP